MSADALPITSARFAKALSDLSISSLYAKVAELQNSIAHLEKSNAELEEYVRVEMDRELYEAIVENREVIARMEERIGLVKKEVVEVRGLPWEPESRGSTAEAGERNGRMNGEGGSAANGIIEPRGQERRNEAPAMGEEEEGVFL